MYIKYPIFHCISDTNAGLNRPLQPPIISNIPYDPIPMTTSNHHMHTGPVPMTTNTTNPVPMVNNNSFPVTMATGHLPPSNSCAYSNYAQQQPQQQQPVDTSPISYENSLEYVQGASINDLLNNPSQYLDMTNVPVPQMVYNLPGNVDVDSVEVDHAGVECMDIIDTVPVLCPREAPCLDEDTVSEDIGPNLVSRDHKVSTVDSLKTESGFASMRPSVCTIDEISVKQERNEKESSRTCERDAVEDIGPLVGRAVPVSESKLESGDVPQSRHAGRHSC